MNRAYIQDKRKLVFIVNSTLIGGHEVQARYLVKDFVAAGADIVVLCPDEKICEYFRETGAAVCHVAFNVKGKVWKQIAARKMTAELMSSFVVDQSEVVVSGGSIEATINPAMAIRMLNPGAHIVSYVPMYIDRSLTHGFVGHLYNCLLDGISKVVDEYLTVNRIQAKIIQTRTGVLTKYILNRVRPVTKPQQTFGPRLVYVGRFDDNQKDVTGLLSLIDHPTNPYRNILLIGDGPDKEVVLDAAKRVKHLKVEAKGWLNSEQIDETVGKDDVLILNSRWEGEPLVVREFLEKGLPCIAKDIPGVRGVVDRRLRFRNQSELLSILRTTYDK